MNTTEQSRNPADVQTEHALNALAAVRSELVQASAVIDNLESEVLPNVFGEFARTLDESSKRDGALVIMTRLVKSLCDAVREKIPIAEPNDLLENVKSLVTQETVNDSATTIIMESLKTTRLKFVRGSVVEARVHMVCERFVAMSKEPKMQSDTIRVLELYDGSLELAKEVLGKVQSTHGGIDRTSDLPDLLADRISILANRVNHWKNLSEARIETIQLIAEERDQLRAANSDQRELIDKITKEREELTRKLGETIVHLRREIEEVRGQAIKS